MSLKKKKLDTFNNNGDKKDLEMKQTIVSAELDCDLFGRLVVVCLFLLLYVPCQQLWSLRDGQFT